MNLFTTKLIKLLTSKRQTELGFEVENDKVEIYAYPFDIYPSTINKGSKCFSRLGGIT